MPVLVAWSLPGCANTCGITSLKTDSPACVVRRRSLAKNDRHSQPPFRGFLVLRVHFLGRKGHGRDRCIEINAPLLWDFFACDAVSGPRLDCSVSAALNARDLDVSGDRVARHA